MRTTTLPSRRCLPPTRSCSSTGPSVTSGQVIEVFYEVANEGNRATDARVTARFIIPTWASSYAFTSIPAEWVQEGARTFHFDGVLDIGEGAIITATLTVGASAPRSLTLSGSVTAGSGGEIDGSNNSYIHYFDQVG
jgi:hypothetical protein